MRRKLISHGPSSLTLSLPRKWIQQNNLRKGEDLEVIEDENQLIIRLVGITHEDKLIEVSLIGLEKTSCEEIILALHKKGYDEIKLTIDRQDMIKDIHAFLNHMQIGFEIIKQDCDCIVIRNISNPEAEQFSNLFRRVFRITIEYANKIEKVMYDKNEMTHSGMLHQTSINRISNYCKRIIIKERHKNACFFYAMIEELNDITYNLVLFLNNIMDSEECLPKNVATKYSEVTDILIKVYELHYKFSMKEYNNIKNNLESAKKSLYRLRAKGNRENYIDSIELVREGVSRLLESALATQF